MSSMIQVVETTSGEVLFQCPFEEDEKAYAYAREMEAMGLDITIKKPSVAQTLVNELGLNEEDRKAYDQSLEEEILEHDSGCCTTSPEAQNEN